VQRDTVLEQHHQQEGVRRVAQVVRVPALVLAHPEDAVADVAVHVDDVRVGVVHVVVRVAPLVARASRIPLEVAARQRRIAHPVVLAVHDVVADLHVVQDLRRGQHGGARDPGRREDAREQQGSAANLECALRLDDSADVGGVALTQVGDDACAQRVEFGAEGFGHFRCHRDGFAADDLGDGLLDWGGKPIKISGDGLVGGLLEHGSHG
jgi:hypothetical protein